MDSELGNITKDCTIEDHCGTFSMYDLARAYIKRTTLSLISPEIGLCAVTSTCFYKVDTRSTMWALDLWNHAKALVPHLNSLSNGLHAKNQISLRLLLAQGLIGQYLRASGRFGEALKLGEQRLDDAVYILGEHHLEILRSNFELACVYRALGRNGEAESRIEKLLQAMEVAFTRGRKDFSLESMCNVKRALAEIYTENGRYKEALTLLAEVTAVLKECNSEEDVDYLIALGSPGSLYCEQEYYNKAEAIQSVICAILTKKKSERDLWTV